MCKSLCVRVPDSCVITIEDSVRYMVKTVERESEEYIVGGNILSESGLPGSVTHGGVSLIFPLLNESNISRLL